MPSVPRDLPNVGLAPLPGGRLTGTAPIETFGGGIAATRIDLSGPMAEAEQIAAEAKRNADNTAVVAAGTQAAKLEGDLTTDARAHHGRDAFGLPESVGQAWAVGMAEIEKGLSNDVQRGQFQSIRAAHERELYGVVQTHVAQERALYTGQTYDSGKTEEFNTALKVGTVPAIAQGVVTLKGLDEKFLTQHYGGKGNIPEHLLENTQAASASGLHVAYLAQLVNQRQMVTARAYLAAHREEILGSQIGEVDKLVKTGTVLGLAQEAFDKIRVQPGLTEGPAIEQARQEKDPEVRQETERLVASEFAKRDKERADTVRDNYQEATNVLENAQGNLRAIPTTLFSSLPLGERQSLRAYARTLTEGTPVKTQLGVYQEWYGKMLDPLKRVEFLKANILGLQDRLDPADLRFFLQAQQQLKQKDPAFEAKLRDMTAHEEIIGRAMRGAGLEVHFPGQPALEPIHQDIENRLRQAIRYAVTEFQVTTGKIATGTDVAEIANEIVTKHIVTGPKFGYRKDTELGAKRIDELTPAMHFGVKYEDISPMDRTRVADLLRREGQPVNEGMIVVRFRQLLEHYRSLVPPKAP